MNSLYFPLGEYSSIVFFFACSQKLFTFCFCRYVIHILPVLLICFSDPVIAVRDATDAAARAIMSQLSGPGVKLVLPALMKVVIHLCAHVRIYCLYRVRNTSLYRRLFFQFAMYLS